MLLIKTKLNHSKISGIGLFADQFIPKGTVMWKFKQGFDLRFDKTYIDSLNEETKEFIMRYACQNATTLNYTLSSGNARFINHSLDPNMIQTDDPCDEDGIDIAARDIHPDEEITMDYRSIDTDPFYGF